MKTKLIIIISVIFIMVSLSGLSMIPDNYNSNNISSPATSFSPSISYPSFVYKGEAFDIYVNETSGYHNYSVSAYFGGTNLTSFSPSVYHKTSHNNTNFAIPVTAPLNCQEVYINIISIALNTTNSTATISNNININVSNPVLLNATIKNSIPMPIYNITVSYYINGAIVGANHINSIGPKSTSKVNITVPAATVPKGKDTLTISVNNPDITVTGKSSVNFYYGSPPNYDWVYYIAAVVVAIAIFLVLASGRRNTVKVPKWKRRKKKLPKTKKS